ncbi:hypothetical protein C7B61_16910, partial [filamentous cyanobacterium CCP1]
MPNQPIMPDDSVSPNQPAAPNELITHEAFQALRQELNTLLQRVAQLEQTESELVQLARQKTLFGVVSK